MILTAFVYSTQFKCNISLHSNSVIMPAPCIVSGCDWFVDFWRIAHELISGCDWFLPYFGCKLNSNGLLPDRPAEQILMLAALMSSQASQAKPIQVSQSGWSCLFRQMIVSHLSLIQSEFCKRKSFHNVCYTVLIWHSVHVEIARERKQKSKSREDWDVRLMGIWWKTSAAAPTIQRTALWIKGSEIGERIFYRQGKAFSTWKKNKH